MTSYALKPGEGRSRLRHRQGLRREIESPPEGGRAALQKYRRRLQAGMRYPARTAALTAPQAMAPTLPALGVVVWNRAAFGPRPGDLQAFEALGGNDADRLAAWVAQQTNPASIVDAEADARLAAAGYTTLNKTLGQLWADHVVADPQWSERMRPVGEVTFATFLRAVYSRRQLFEVMADFWHNHFSIYGWDYYEGPTWAYYDRDVIRANALGNFRTFLGAVARSTPMLFYLDNWRSSEDGPNENYAREMLELHALGEENYYGAVPRNQVPVDGNGVQLGFVDEDVFAVTRCLTGWSVDGDPWWRPKNGNGGFFYRSDWHDNGSKNVLGVTLAANQPAEKDGNDVLDILAAHPGTARFICRKLCQRLISDFPPESVVETAAQVFASNVSAPDQIARVVETILLSPEFAATWGGKVKRPYELAMSALRAGGADFPFVLGESDSESFDWRFYNTGHYPFSWHPPNGYPDVAEAWVSSGPRVMSWRLLNWLVDVTNDYGAYRLDGYAQTPPQFRTPTELADYWIDRILGRAIGASDRQEIIEFMAQGRNPDFDLPLDSDEDVRERLQSMIGLLFSSPEFLWR